MSEKCQIQKRGLPAAASPASHRHMLVLERVCRFTQSSDTPRYTQVEQQTLELIQRTEFRGPSSREGYEQVGIKSSEESTRP